jgi:4-hydroxy-3-methylbut-2-enyl diphosphate reductase
LRELGERCGIPSYLIDSYQDIQTQWLEGVQAIGIAAGASAPEVLVTQVIKFLKEQGADTVEELTVVEENVEFLLPKELLMAKGKR